MNRMTPEHLARDAYVYVRQSTPDQLLNNPESRRRQYDLVTRARSLGWEKIIVIDDDFSAARVVANSALDSSVSSRRSAPAAPALCWRSRPHGWHAKRPRLAHATGILCFREQPDH
jgi:hypothetical protein